MTEQFPNLAAVQEGWRIVRGDGVCKVERVASSSSFENDEQALLFVVTAALEGSEYHTEALAFLRSNDPGYKSWNGSYDTAMATALTDWVGGELADEGCFISHCYGASNGDRWQLQRDDETEVFKSDDKAAIHVVKKAASGSEYHRRVLRFLEIAQPNEHERIMALSPRVRVPSP